MQVIAALLVLSLTLLVPSLAAVVRLPLHRAAPSRDHVDSLRSAATGEIQSEHTSIPLVKFQSDSRYYTMLGFGTPPQFSRLVINTGGSELWVPSVMCRSRGCTKRQSFKYDREQSSTFKATEDYMFLEYPQGANVSGPMSVDTVTIGDVAVQNQRFLEGVSVTGAVIMNYDWDAILGMGGPPQDGLVPLFYNMISQGLVSRPVFSYYTDRDLLYGELILGGSDPTSYIGSLKYTNLVESQYLWTIPMQSFGMGNTSYCDGDCGSVMIDTGNGVINGPTNIIRQINKNMGGFESGGVHVVPCDNVPSLSTITFSFGDNQFSLTPDEYIIKESFPALGFSICLSAFVEIGDMKFWNFGDPFFKSHYVEFDMGNKRIGIAHSKTSVNS